MLQPLLLRLFGIGINLSVSRTASVVGSDWGVWGEVEDFHFLHGSSLTPPLSRDDTPYFACLSGRR